MNDSETNRRDLRPALVFLSGELIAVPIPLEREDVILGRALEADVRVNDTQVSRQHARITTTKDLATGKADYTLIDLNSRNGTFLNSRRITMEKLNNGDKIAIGETILRFDLLDEIDREYHLQIHLFISPYHRTGLLSTRLFFSDLSR